MVIGAHGVFSLDTIALAKLFEPPIEIMFYGTLNEVFRFYPFSFSFTQAIAQAAQQRKWVLVNIQDPSVFECQILNRDVWGHSVVVWEHYSAYQTWLKVQELLTNYFIFIQEYVEAEAGKNYINLYRINKLPHIAIIDPLTGERVKQFKRKTTVDSVMEECEWN